MFVRISGEIHGSFKPTRGVRRGDPISPYRFIFVAEGLSQLFKSVEFEGRISGVKISRSAPSLP